MLRVALHNAAVGCLLCGEYSFGLRVYEASGCFARKIKTFFQIFVLIDAG